MGVLCSLWYYNFCELSWSLPVRQGSVLYLNKCLNSIGFPLKVLGIDKEIWVIF